MSDALPTITWPSQSRSRPGQAVNPVHTEAWKQYLDIMRQAGFTDAELDVMTRKNTAALLGLN